MPLVRAAARSEPVSATAAGVSATAAMSAAS